MPGQPEQVSDSNVTVPPLLAPGAPVEPHPLKALVVYLLAVFLGAALIAPRFHASAEFLAENYRGFRWLTDLPFHQYVHRCLLLLAIVGLPLFLKALRIRSAADLGLRLSARNWGEALQGFAWGFAMLAAVAALSITFHSRTVRLSHAWPEWSNHLQSTVLVMLLVAVLEEALFRGALFGALRRRYRFWSAAFLSGAVYALLHFFARPDEPRFIMWSAGLQVLGEMLVGFTQWESLFPGFLNLTLLGLIFALALERTGSLLFGIGLHASIIGWLKTLNFLTRPINNANTWAWGGAKVIDGWACAFILLAVLCLLHATLPRPPPNDA